MALRFGFEPLGRCDSSVTPTMERQLLVPVVEIQVGARSKFSMGDATTSLPDQRVRRDQIEPEF